MKLDAYRLFTDEEGLVYVVAKKDGDRVVTLCETEYRDDAYKAILDDAGFKIPVLERDMDLGGRSYKPVAEDWE